MQLHWPKNKRLYVRLFLLLGPILTIMAACGGGSSDSSTPSSNIITNALQVQFSSTVLDHFQDDIVTLQNNGTSSVSIGQIAHADPLYNPFSIIDDQCSGITLTPSETCTLKVRFSPTSQNSFNDSFDIPSSTGQTIMTVSVSGDAKALNVSINQTDTSGCPGIRLFITVTDRNDDPMTSLTQADFLVIEDNNLQVIDSISNIVMTPISVALVLDYSGSIQPFISNVEAAATSFIDQLDLNNNTDEAAIIKFAASIELKQAFTDDYNSLLLAIGDNFTGNIAKTLLYDAVWQAVNITTDLARNDRRVIVVLSDGIDEGSVDHNLTEIIDSTHKNGVAVFTIGLGNVFLPAMQLLADETGGQYFLAPTSSDLQAIYQQIADILTNQYVIEYQSPSSSGDSITIDMEVDHNDMQGEASRTVPGC